MPYKQRGVVVYSKELENVWPLCALILLVLPFVLLGDLDLPLTALEEEGFLPDPIPVNPLWSSPSDATVSASGSRKTFARHEVFRVSEGSCVADSAHTGPR